MDDKFLPDISMELCNIIDNYRYERKGIHLEHDELGDYLEKVCKISLCFNYRLACQDYYNQYPWNEMLYERLLQDYKDTMDKHNISFEEAREMICNRTLKEIDDSKIKLSVKKLLDNENWENENGSNNSC